MSKVTRIYPGAVNELIQFLEENFHEIDGFIATFHLANGEIVTTYEAGSYLEAAGLVAITQDTIDTLARDGEFVARGRG